MENSSSGWRNGLIGVTIFAGSLPATRAAVTQFNPLFLTSARASTAALLGAALLLVLRQRTPERAQLLSLAVTALGVVLGFPLLTALALQHVTSAHSIVFLGLLPLCTAIFAVLRGDALMLAAVVVCGLGYAEGARLSKTLGGWQVISWALLLASPVMLPIALITQPASFAPVTLAACIALAYVSVFSMLVGFIF